MAKASAPSPGRKPVTAESGAELEAKGDKSDKTPPESKCMRRGILDFEPLQPAERILLTACVAGENAEVSVRLPTGPDPDRNIRSDFLRFLTLGGEGEIQVHERGISVSGAFITDSFDLMACSVTRPLSFSACAFEAPILLLFSKVSNILFTGCSVKGISAIGCTFGGSLIFSRGSKCSGTIILMGASIDGNLSLSGATLYNPRATTLIGDNLVIKGNAFLDSGFRSFGEIRFNNARINGGFTAKLGSFINRRGFNFSADGCIFGSTVAVSDGFRSIGELRFVRSFIAGDLDCEDAEFRNSGGLAFNARSVEVSGGLFWRDVKAVQGIVSLDAGRCADLVDDWESWEKADHLILDGFTFKRISGGRSPVDARTRIKWLRHQKPQAFGGMFWPQPWEQAAAVLRQMGHVEDAKIIAIEKHREMRRRGLIGNLLPKSTPIRMLRPLFTIWTFILNWFSRILHISYGALAGYGYRPLRTFVLMTMFWLVGTAAFSIAEGRGLFVPSAVGLITDKNYERCGPLDAGGVRWTRCPDLPRDYTTFDPLMYSLDVILPLVDLKQENDWEPLVRRGRGWEMWDGLLVRGIMWAEILFGWIGSLLIVSALGRLVQKD